MPMITVKYNTGVRKGAPYRVIRLLMPTLPDYTLRVDEDGMGHATMEGKGYRIPQTRPARILAQR